MPYDLTRSSNFIFGGNTMTLNVTANQIQIKNSLGQLKFNSNDKLVYEKYYQSGTVSVASAQVNIPFQTLGTQEFLLINIMLTSGTGVFAGVTALAGKLIPANGSLLVDFYGRDVGNQAGADSEHLGVELIGSNLVFKTIRFNNNSVMTNGTTTNTLKYSARVWSYL